MVKLKHYQLSPQVETKLSLSAPHQQNLSVLQASPQWQDSIFYTFFMLPFAQSLELAMTFIARVYETQFTQGERELFLQARRWQACDDESRHALFEQAETLGFDNPISCLVLALFLSKGSMVPAGLEAVYPKPWQAPLTLANTLCLILHGFSEDPQRQATCLEQFIQAAQERFNAMTQAMDSGRQHYLYQDVTVQERL